MRKNLPVTGQEKSFHPSANILSTTNTKGQITYCNEDFTDVAGFSMDELSGQPHNIIRHPDMPPAAFAMLWDNLKNGRSWKGIVKNRCKNGDHYWVDAYATPITKDGQAVEYQSVRVLPHQEDVYRASKLYERLNQGDEPRFLKRKPMGLVGRLWLLLIAGLALGGLVAQLAPGFELIAGSVITLLIVGAGFSWLLAPLSKAVEMANSISEDLLAMHVYTGRNDEAGQLMLAMKVLQSEANGIVGRIADKANGLASSNVIMSRALSSNDEIVQRLQAETEAVATSIDQMSASIQEVASSTSQAAVAASDANTNASQAKRVIDTTMESIAGLANDIRSAADVVTSLEKESADISSIVDVIRSVAEQTNLLALNAAIEAARAGEQGRGFAVVADEVRTLANRTHRSTDEITQMIKKLQDGAKNAVDKMEIAQERTEISVTNANEASNAISAISESIDQISQMSTQVAAATEEQSMVAEEVNKNITRVLGFTEESHTSATSLRSVNNDVQRLADSMRELSNQFWNSKAG